MKRIAVGAVVLAMLGAVPAQARDGAMERVLSCKGPDASMEFYLPEDVLTGAMPAKGAVEGMYALDLSGAMKGKHLERVRISESPDHNGIVVNQNTRGLPATTIPKAGGTVDFDQRFGTHAVCGKFGAQ